MIKEPFPYLLTLAFPDLYLEMGLTVSDLTVDLDPRRGMILDNLCTNLFLEFSSILYFINETVIPSSPSSYEDIYHLLSINFPLADVKRSRRCIDEFLCLIAFSSPRVLSYIDTHLGLL